jgi:hypothetical protein
MANDRSEGLPRPLATDPPNGQGAHPRAPVVAVPPPS